MIKKEDIKADFKIIEDPWQVDPVLAEQYRTKTLAAYYEGLKARVGDGKAVVILARLHNDDLAAPFDLDDLAKLRNLPTSY